MRMFYYLYELLTFAGKVARIYLRYDYTASYGTRRETHRPFNKFLWHGREKHRTRNTKYERGTTPPSMDVDDHKMKFYERNSITRIEYFDQFVRIEIACQVMYSVDTYS